MTPHSLTVLAVAAGLCCATQANAQTQIPIDLNQWSAESYPSVSGFSPGNWVVTANGDSVDQTVNGQPTLFYSDFNVLNLTIEGTISQSGGDDDYLGFAIGFNPGDSTNPNADFLLIDWKRSTQSFNFGSPSCTPGSVAPRGLAVSRVRGTPTADEFWGHVDLNDPACSTPSDSVTELARGNTLGATGWSRNTAYQFVMEFSATRLRVWVDSTLELDVSGFFATGRMAFYNFSQSGVNYQAFTRDCTARTRNYGAGFPGTNGFPTLVAMSNPLLGAAVDIVANTAANSTQAAGLQFGFAPINVPTPFGGSLLVSVAFASLVQLTPAGFTRTLNIPNQPAVCGSSIYAQLLHLDPGAAFGIAFSDGLELIVGN